MSNDFSRFQWFSIDSIRFHFISLLFTFALNVWRHSIATPPPPWSEQKVVQNHMPEISSDVTISAAGIPKIHLITTPPWSDQKVVHNHTPDIDSDVTFSAVGNPENPPPSPDRSPKHIQYHIISKNIIESVKKTQSIYIMKWDPWVGGMAAIPFKCLTLIFLAPGDYLNPKDLIPKEFNPKNLNHNHVNSKDLHRPRIHT